MQLFKPEVNVDGVQWADIQTSISGSPIDSRRDWTNQHCKGFRMAQFTDVVNVDDKLGMFHLSRLDYNSDSENSGYVSLRLMTFNEDNQDLFSFYKKVNFNEEVNVTEPLNSTNPVTKQYADNLVQGLVNLQLQNLSNLNSLGFVSLNEVSNDGTSSFVNRKLVAGQGIVITNNDGALGDPTISISNITISDLVDFPNDSSLSLRGDGSWASTAVETQLPRDVHTDLFYGGSFNIYNSNNLTTDTGFGVFNQNTNAGVKLGLNVANSEAYVYSGSDLSLKFGTNNTTRIKINTDGNITCYNNNLSTSGVLSAQTGTIEGNSLSSYNSDSILCKSSFSNLSVSNDIGLNNHKITSGLSSMAFVNGTLEVNGGGIMAGREYSFGWLNSSGGTGVSSGSMNFYDIVCTSRIAASEFNATSSQKIKKIDSNFNIHELIDKFLKIDFKKYSYIDRVDGHGDHYGVIAEELAEIFPQFVNLEQVRHVPNCVDQDGRMFKIHLKLKEDTTCIFNHSIDLTQIDRHSKHIRLCIDNLFIKAKLNYLSDEEISVSFEKSQIKDINNSLVKNKNIFAYGTYEKCPSVEKNKLAEIGLAILQFILKKTSLHK